jgi:hypothetical protein
VSREFWHKILGLCGVLLSGDSGVFGVEVERRLFPRFAEVRQGFLGSAEHTGSFRPLFPYLFLRLKVSLPGVVGVTIKAIVVHGDLRETIRNVSGKP